MSGVRKSNGSAGDELAEPNKGGRPTKLSAELQAAIVAAVESGIMPDAAAAEAGVDPATYYRWVSRGKAGEEPFQGFARAITRARLTSEARLVRRTLEGDDRGTSFGPSKAALEMLSRIRPDRYSASMKVQLRDDLERILDVVERICGTDNFLAVVAALADDDSARASGEADSSQEPVHH